MSRKDWRSCLLVVVGILLSGLVVVAYTGLTPPEGPTAIAAQGATATPTGGPTPAPTGIVEVEVPVEVRREFDIVWAGGDGPEPSSLPRLEDDEWHDLPAGGWVSTDNAGEGVVRFDECRIYIFQASGLQKSTCPKSESLSGNVFCSYAGTSVFNNQCAPKIVIQTEGVQVLEGAWMSVIHLREKLVTIVLSFKGQARVEPVLDVDTNTRGEASLVQAGYFWVSTPGVTADPIAGLAARQAHSFEQFMPLVEELDLWRWMPSIQRRAQLDNITYPAVPPFVCGAPDHWVLYVVQANDTLFSLAAETGTSVEGIRWANCLGDDTLTAGQPLYLPSLPPPAPPTPTSIPTPVPTPTALPRPTEIPAADLRIDKRGPAEPVLANQGYSYTVTVTNDGPFAAQNVRVLDSLPAGVMALGVSTAGCDNDRDGVPTCELGPVAAGGSVSYTINLTATGALLTITNNVRVTSSTQDPNTNNNQDSVDTPVIPYANLSIEKKDSSDPVSTNQAYGYTVTVTNKGPSRAQDVTVIDTLPDGVTFGSADEGCTYDRGDGAVTCKLDTIAAGGSRSFTINVTAPGRELIDIIAPGRERVITNTVIVTSITAEQNDKDNHTEEPTKVIHRPDLVVEKKDSADPVFVNQAYSYTVTVTNKGPSSAQDVTVIDTLPGGVTFGSADEGCTYDRGDSVVTCKLDTIAADGSRSFTINVTAPGTAGTITNPVTVTSTTDDQNVDDNHAEEPTTVSLPTTDLVISKDNGTTKTVRGTSTTYTIAVSNDGPIDVKGALVTDSFPAAQLTHVRWTCAATGGAICTASSSDNITDRVDIPVGGAAIYTVDADVLDCATGPRLVNTAAVIPPDGVIDANPDNNSDTDTDWLTFEPSIMNTLLWIVQILLAILFIVSGALKLTRPQVRRVSQSKAVSAAYAKGTTGTRLIGLLEILGAVGLVLPALTCVVPRLTSLAAAGLALLTVGAIIIQADWRKKDWMTIVTAIVLLALAYFVAYGRFILVPLHCVCAGIR